MNVSKGDYIDVIGYGYIESITNMVRYHYDIPDLNNCVINCCVMYSLDEIRANYNDDSKGYILYDLEHILDRHNHINFDLVKSILKWNTIWEFDVVNYYLLKSVIDYLGLDNQLYFMPVRWYPISSYVHSVSQFDFDLLFYGALNDRRLKYLQDVSLYPSTVRLMALTGIRYRDMGEYLSRSKFILNIHQESDTYQEQVRIFENILQDKTVITEPSKVNYFDEMVYELSINMIGDSNYLTNLTELHPNILFKRKTNTTSDFDNYRNKLLEDNKYILDEYKLNINFNKYHKSLW